MRLTWVSGCAMVHSGPEPGAGMTALVAKASGSTELPVVVTSHTLRLVPAMMNELADVLAERLPQRCNRIRLVAWNSGCLHDDRPAPAYQLATRLGVEVIAPAGPLLGVPGGSLFAPAGRGAQRPGGWWRFAPGSAPSRVGWRYPAPPWDADLGEVGELGHDLVVDQVPAGIWLHRSGYRSVTDLVYSVPVDPADPALIVSHPNEKPLQPDEIARVLTALPRRTAERLVFTPYGPRPVTDGRLGEVAAAVLRAPVRVRAGLPLFAAGGKRALVTVDSGGRPCWRPFVRELRYHPHGLFAEAADWVNPAPGLLAEPVDHAAFSLGSGWAAEVIEAGLWIRPAQLTEPTDRALPPDVDQCTILIGTPSTGCPPPPGPAISDLLRNLPADARSRLRVAVHQGTSDAVMILASALCDELPSAGEVRLLGPTAAPPVHQPTPHPVRQPLPAQQPIAPAATRALREPTPYPVNPISPPVGEPVSPLMPYPMPELDPQPITQSIPAAIAEPSMPLPVQPIASPVQPIAPPLSPIAPPASQPQRRPRHQQPAPPQSVEFTAVQPSLPPLGQPPAPPSPPPVSQPAHAARQPTPYPPHPAQQLAPRPAHAAPPPPAHAAPPMSRMPSVPPMAPAPPMPARVPAHAAVPPSPPYPAPPVQHPVRQPTPYPGHPVQQPTPYPGHPVQQHTPYPGHPLQPPQPVQQHPGQAQHPVQQHTPYPGHPVQQHTPYPGHPVQQPAPPPSPAVYGTPVPSPEDSQPLPRTEIRSHRTAGGKATKPVEDRATTSELNRLLGFFDEIRKARAWDEEPASSH
jgi:hypothetical protein